jgi:integrase
VPRHEYVLTQQIETYLDQLRIRQKAQPGTITEYRRLIRQATDAWYDADMRWSPRTVREQEIDYLLEEIYGHLEPHTARIQLSIIGTYLKKQGKNPIVENMSIPWPPATRQNVKWLEPMQARKLMDSAVGMERILIHCELQLLMRRCEVMRLHVEDITRGAVQIRGKGKFGGKPRTISYHPRTIAELGNYMDLREVIAEKALKLNPVVAIPNELLIYERFGKVGVYQMTSVDGMIKTAAERAGLDPTQVSNHVLRRTGGRMMWLAGEKVATIMQILGHVSEAQTIAYLGINIDDMRAGMQRAADYWDSMTTGTKRAEPVR